MKLGLTVDAPDNAAELPDGRERIVHRCDSESPLVPLLRSDWLLDGRRVKVTRELVIRHDRGYCLSQDERDFAAVREALWRDLLAQIVFGP